MGFVYVPHGAIMDQWTPTAEGANFEFSRVLKPLEPHRQYVNVISGLGNRAADSTAVHSLSPTTWLSGVRPKPTQGVDAYAGITADQIAAQHISQDTLLPSIELATEDHSALLGACDRDYGCIYMNTLSWRTHTTPMPMEINPRKAFERMFGQGGSQADRTLRNQQDRSILDEITAEAKDLKSQPRPARPRHTQRLHGQRARNGTAHPARRLPADRRGAGPAHRAGRHPVQLRRAHQPDVRLLVLGYQANITRVFTYMVAREESNKTYPQVGVHDGHHATSHHQNRPEKIEKLVKIQNYHVGLFAGFLDKLKKTPDGDGKLLDHSVILYGSNMSNSNLHNHFPLPNLVAGGACGQLQGGRHLRYTGPHAHGELAAHAARQESAFRKTNIGDSTGELINL